MAFESSARPPAVDLLPERRPGVPMEPPPRRAVGSHWERPEQQPAQQQVLHRSELTQLTPVFGTAQPPAGLSGAIRKLAYAIPESLVRHWMLLMVADRVDSFGHRLKRPSTWVAIAAAAGGYLLLRETARMRAAPPL